MLADSHRFPWQRALTRLRAGGAPAEGRRSVSRVVPRWLRASKDGPGPRLPRVHRLSASTGDRLRPRASRAHRGSPRGAAAYHGPPLTDGLLRARSGASTPTRNRPFTHARLSFGGHMTDSASTTIDAPRFALGDGTAAFAAAVERARSEDWVNRIFARDATLWSSDARVQEAILDRLGWLDAPAHFSERTAGPRGLRRRRRRRGLHDRHRRRDGRQQPGPGHPPSHLRQPGRLPRAAHPRLDRSGLRRGDPERPRPAADDDDHRQQVRHDDRAERLPRLPVEARPGRPRRRRAPHLRPSRRLLRGRHGPGQEPRRDQAPRRLPRGLPQPAGHRRPVLGADLCRARAGVADRPGPRRAAGLRDHDARRLPPAGPRDEPGRSRSASPSARWPPTGATS